MWYRQAVQLEWEKTLERLQLCYFQSKTNGFIEKAEEETYVRYGIQRGRQTVDEIFRFIWVHMNELAKR